MRNRVYCTLPTATGFGIFNNGECLYRHNDFAELAQVCNVLNRLCSTKNIAPSRDFLKEIICYVKPKRAVVEWMNMFMYPGIINELKEMYPRARDRSPINADDSLYVCEEVTNED